MTALRDAAEMPEPRGNVHVAGVFAKPPTALAVELLEIEAGLDEAFLAFGNGMPSRGEAVAKRRIQLPAAVADLAERYGELLLESAIEGRTTVPLAFIDREVVPAWFSLYLGLRHLVDWRLRSLGRRSESTPAEKPGELASCAQTDGGEIHG